MEATLTAAADRPAERRRSVRWTGVDGHGVVSAQVRPGREITIVNLSANGALVETAHRLLPGTAVDVQLETSDCRAMVRGRVVRCSVAALGSSCVRYRGAIAFDGQVSWLTADAGYELPGADARRFAAVAAGLTRTDPSRQRNS